MYSNITDITEKSMDIQELLMDTDILVTDYSSTYRLSITGPAGSLL